MRYRRCNTDIQAEIDAHDELVESLHAYIEECREDGKVADATEFIAQHETPSRKFTEAGRELIELIIEREAAQ